MAAHLTVIPARSPLWRTSVCWFLASTADSFLLFVVLWVAGPEGWSGLQTAAVVLALRMPALAGGAAGGRIVDRLGGRSGIMLDAAGRALILAALAVSGWSGALPLTAVLLLGALASLLTPASYSGARWLVGRLSDPQRLPRANAILSLGDLIPTVLGGALVGPVLALLGPGPALLVPVGMLAIVGLLAIDLPQSPPHLTAGRRPDPTATVAPGEERAQPRGVTALIALSFGYYFAFGPFETVIPPLVREQLGAGQELYGTLWMLFGLAALATLPLAPRLARQRPGAANALGAVLWGAVMLPIAFVGEPVVALAVFLLGGAVWGPYTAVEATAIHHWTDAGRQGQVFGIQRGLLSAAVPLGAAAGAIGLEFASPGTVVAVSCVGCVCIGLVALSFPDLRRRVSRPMEVEADSSLRELSAP